MEKLVYKASGKTYDFRKFQTTKTFGEDIYEVEITFKEVDKEQSDLLDEIRNFNDKTRPKNYKKKQEKQLLLIICIHFLAQEKWFLVVLKAKYF